MRDRAPHVLAAALSRPLHAVTFALVVGLLCGARALPVAIAAAVVLAAGAAWALAAHRATEADAASDGDASPAVPVPWPDRRDLLKSGCGLLVVMAVAVSVGAAGAHWRVAQLERTTLAGGFGHGLAEEVVVQDAPRASDFGGWFAMARLRGEPVLLRAQDDALPAPGTRLAVRGSLRAPGEYAVRRRAHAELRAESVVVVGRRGGAAGLVDGIRTRAELALDRGLPPAAAGLLRGMVLGQDDALPEETRDAFRAAGLSHLVAASGTNVVLLAALAMALGTALGLGLTGRLWLVLALIALYVLLAGGGASIQRAGIMGAAAVAAGLVGRPASRWYALGLAAVVTLALDPRAAGEPGWQLSFVAVLSLLLLAPRWRAVLVRVGTPGALADVLAMTGAATVATAPVVAAHFGQASLVGVPANLLAAPAVAPVMWLGVLAAALGQVLALGGPLGTVAGGLVDGLDALAGFPLGYLLWVGTHAARAPGAVLETGPAAVGAAVVAVLAVALSRRARRVAPVAAVAGSALWIGLAPAAAAPAGPPAGFRLSFLDVGQGDATLLQAGGRSVLVDAGLPDAGVVGRLRRAGVARLDVLVVTHADADHLGGAASVVAALPVGLVLDGRDGVANAAGAALDAAAQARGVRSVRGQAGQELRVGGIRLRVLWPRAEPAALHAGADPNDRAIVLEAEADGARVLLTADAESDVLLRLDLERVDVLKVSHHGSVDPGLPSVLARVAPRIAGIEVGAGNTYGHPAPSTLAALAGVPTVFRTDRDGTVRLDLGPDGRWEVRAHA